MSLVQFWHGHSFDVDMDTLNSAAVSVKGKCYHNPGRCLEIFANLSDSDCRHAFAAVVDNLSYDQVRRMYLPQTPGVAVGFGEHVYQPPFNWKDSSPLALTINFTYNTNAIFRVLCNLSDQGLIQRQQIDKLLDRACVLLSYIYRMNGSEVLKGINNNLNMFLISKVIEHLVGTDVYNSEYQELIVTAKSLTYALEAVEEHAGLTVTQQMAVALGRGVAFVENALTTWKLPIGRHSGVFDNTYRYVETALAIDHRARLIDRVSLANDNGNTCTMCAILDDTVESVADLLWIQQMLQRFPRFRVTLLVNRLQISINFSSSMLEAVFRRKEFAPLHSLLGQQFFVQEISSPLISLQRNFLSPETITIIQHSDFVYVKGANFFETCQFEEVDSFYAFVVYGPMSQLYTGLSEYDAVFAYLPRGYAGYVHSQDLSKLRNLKDVCENLFGGGCNSV